MIVLDGSSLTIEQLVAIADAGERVTLDQAARARVGAARAVVEARAGGDAPAYGINTGFGSFAEVKIAPDALNALLNERVHPCVPSRGSVGASGDLAPLAHLALVLIGEGEILDDQDGH